jgi:hypothetical protein
MSKRNGDKARAQREQKKKLLRRKRNQALRQGLANKATAGAVPNPGRVETETEQAA